LCIIITIQFAIIINIAIIIDIKRYQEQYLPHIRRYHAHLQKTFIHKPSLKLYTTATLKKHWKIGSPFGVSRTRAARGIRAFGATATTKSSVVMSSMFGAFLLG